MSEQIQKLYMKAESHCLCNCTCERCKSCQHKPLSSSMCNHQNCGHLSIQGFPSGSGDVNPLLNIMNFNMDKQANEFYEDVLKKLKLDPEEKKLAKSILSEVLKSDTHVKWQDIAGLTEPKELLFEALVLPSAIPSYFDKLRKPWKGVLLVGPPGTGKTMLAKAAATETKSNFFNITSSSVTSKWYGDSEKLIRLLFSLAKELSPSIVFFDEIDSMCSHRATSTDVTRRMKSELLCQMDGLASSTNDDPSRSVIILAATNFPWDIDEAFRRRLEKRIYVPLPDLATRTSLLQILLKNVKVDKDVNLSKLATLLEGYSSADITVVCRDAAFMNLRRYMNRHPNVAMKDLPDVALYKSISNTDFDEAICNCPKTVRSEDVEKFKNWIKMFGSE